MEEINKTKIALTALFAGISAALGWFGWLIVGFVGSMALDYITGSLAAGSKGEWSSSRARSGLWHKLGCIAAVLVSAIADGVLGLMVNNMPTVQFGFEYSVLISPLVLVWYIFTELGSIIENAEKLGAPVPSVLRRLIAACKDDHDNLWDRIFAKKPKE